MKAGAIIQFFKYAFLIGFIFVFIYGVVNYTILEKEITKAVAAGGLTMMFILILVFESAPIAVIGPFIPVMGGILVGFNYIWILVLLVIGAVISSTFSFYLGKYFSKRSARLVDSQKKQKYKKLFRKYGRWFMFLAAIGIFPYIPVMIGIFRIKTRFYWLTILPVRIAKHIISSLFLFWFFGAL